MDRWRDIWVCLVGRRWRCDDATMDGLEPQGTPRSSKKCWESRGNSKERKLGLLMNDLKFFKPSGFSVKMAGWDTLPTGIELWRSRGRTRGFTVGMVSKVVLGVSLESRY